MNRRFFLRHPLLVALLVICNSGLIAQASALRPASAEHQISAANAIFRGAVLELHPFEGEDGGIYTRSLIQVDEVFKGKVPKLVQLVHRGGTLADKGELDGLSPKLKVGEERLFVVSRRSDGTLFAKEGLQSALPVSADSAYAPQDAPTQNLLNTLRAETQSGVLPGDNVTDQAGTTQASKLVLQPSVSPSSTATNLLVGTDGIPSRFVLPDRGEPIPYLIDADFLPTGITQTQAVNAVKTALAAWTNASSVRYVFAGIQSFGQAAANVPASDGVLRIQLHDHYNYIGGGSGSGDILGQGGHAWTILNLSSGWTTGGNVYGNDFHRATRGYIVLAHTNTFMQNLSNFTEVLCHEIGHTIGLDHSSENPTEPNPVLNQAIMYFTAHGDGRGAALNSFDTNVCREIHPATNTPPYCYDRVLDIDTTPTRPLNLAGVNSAQIRGYDLQGGTLTMATTDASSINGTFSIATSNITFVPAGFFADAPRIDPTSTSYYDHIYARHSDGTNASPYATIKVVGLYQDSYNEGIPDSWRTNYFGNANPSVGLKHHGTNDVDGDGFSNLTEWLLGSNPTNKTSNLTITFFSKTNLQFQAKPYEVYELYCSTNFTAWSRAMNPIVPTNTVASVTGFPTPGTKLFFRVLKVP